SIEIGRQRKSFITYIHIKGIGIRRYPVFVAYDSVILINDAIIIGVFKSNITRPGILGLERMVINFFLRIKNSISLYKVIRIDRMSLGYNRSSPAARPKVEDMF